MEYIITFSNALDLDDENKLDIRNWRNQDFVRKRMFNDNIISLDEHMKFLQLLNESDNKNLFVCFVNEEPFAVIQYDLFNDNSMEFGYYLINEKWVNSGFGVVLEYALLNHGFYKLNVDVIFCRTLDINKKVIELHKKFGFISESKRIIVNDKYKNICYQYIYKSNWESNKEKIEKIIKYLIPLSNMYGM